MLPEQLHYPAAFYNGHAYFFERASAYSFSYFGGPTSIKFTGLRHGPRRLHRVMTCAIPGLETKGYSQLSLFYGMCYSGCRMTYQIVKLFPYRLLKLEPLKSLADWPYPKYPELLPYVPLRIAKRTRCSCEQFRELLVQKGEVKEDGVTVIVPAIPDLGMSLWGPEGDAERVQIIFQFDVQNAKVTVYNECT